MAKVTDALAEHRKLAEAIPADILDRLSLAALRAGQLRRWLTN